MSENILRRLPIQKGINLGREEWIMAYQHPSSKSSGRRSNYNAANKVYEDLLECSKALGVAVQEPYWIELEDEQDFRTLEEEIRIYLRNPGNGQFRFPKMLVIVLGDE